MKKRMIKLMTIFCMAGILTVNPAIVGLAEGQGAVEADVQEINEKSNEEPNEEPAPEKPEPTVDKIQSVVINYNNKDYDAYTVTHSNPGWTANTEINLNENYPASIREKDMILSVGIRTDY